jgi:hypothetical protein
MSQAVMRKSYTVVCVRTTGKQMELETVSDYNAALTAAKSAIENKSNSEVRIVENKYDQSTRKDKKQVIKILTTESGGSSGASARRAGPTPAVTRETANRATKSLINIVIAVTVLILLAGLLIPRAMR